ncbi:hypothetical protein HID58_075068 [Brassica napus]|uniref:Uncharacterized protein n=1 Tax=Brassica napus TaxID=3708 RepID=A0ABQ7YLL6_BRANA|nr:hypothetical protein HID58_075068 [Brassica napus]
MVSQSNAAGSSGRRCRPNTPKAKPVSRSKKMKRYPVSDSDDDTTPSSMDSTAPTSPPVDAVDVGTSTKFPRRLFAPRFFSTQLRLNIYSKANVIASVASALKGSSAMDCLVPEAERHFWLDEVEDPKVTRLVDHIRSVHTFRTEDFVGGDMSFGKDNAIPEGKPQGVPLIQRTLRPRKRVAVVIEDLTTPEHNEPDVPPESGRSPNEDLKSWILEQFQNFKNGIYERLDQFEKTLCDHFGVPLPNIHNKGKRKVGEDDHGYSGSPKSVENQYKKQRPNRKSRKINSTVPKPGQEMHSYPLRSTVVLEGTIGNTQPGFSRETRENNENSTLLTLQFDQNATDQEPRTPNAVPDESHTPNPLATLTIYRGLLFARPQAYVSPAKKDDTYIGEKAMDVKWDEANPHAYSAVKEVHAEVKIMLDLFPQT